MSNALEQSLDDIIGEQQKARKSERGPRRSGPSDRRGRGRGPRRPPVRFNNANTIPDQILKSADGRPMLRLKNVHPDLNGEDLSNLFFSIAPVDFIKFDPRDEAVAYVCFQSNYGDNNARAVQKFDGRKAMGQTLVVENAVSLADRIAPQAHPRRNAGREREEAPRAREAHRSRAREKKPRQPRKPRPAAKTAEDLDAELSAYMSTEANGGNDNGAFAAQDNGESML
ncbi:uncharacterized protein CXQ87_004518 [Candidozyma duobushaemuli]|uniref:Chromatin target of PRMT1 protein C-terminal domain-containing protein n=2 Tax=Candidozyma TaxID=3303203 RepID=A0ABX8ICU1_9ASCO|nr:uncharacterized protein CXQ87_004518 [[Candida] duobushaemulonis]PVH16960.1 hypothetical protein CXQ87_004518 [[Candida] duobushaemulonis]QWU89733.1 hypothetical protein CA3LBN_004081 [[Candida] haemuloni]